MNAPNYDDDDINSELIENIYKALLRNEKYKKPRPDRIIVNLEVALRLKFSARKPRFFSAIQVDGRRILLFGITVVESKQETPQWEFAWLSPDDARAPLVETQYA